MRTVCSFLVVSLLLSVFARPASAILQFYKVWETEYLTDHPDQDFAKLVKKPANRCFVCHQGKKRKNRNAYGQELSKLLDKKKDKKDTEKILAAIKKVGEMHVDPKDEKSETFSANRGRQVPRRRAGRLEKRTRDWRQPSVIAIGIEAAQHRSFGTVTRAAVVGPGGVKSCSQGR